MFPLTANEPYIKETGERSTLGDMFENGGSGGGGYVLPPATTSKLGGVKIGSGINVSEDGTISSSGLDSYGVYKQYLFGYPIFKPSETQNKYNIGIYANGLSASAARSFNPGDYTLQDVYMPDVFAYTEFYNYLTDEIISELDIESLYSDISSAFNSATLAHPITDYKTLILQGCYDANGHSQYDTTIFYENPDITEQYGFYVKDRNNNYSGVLSFTDSTHVSLDNARRVKIWGIK